MNWLDTIKNAISYIEEHICDIKSADEIANEVYLSSFYLQKGFKLMTGYSIKEYIRNRRLYLAALELRNTNKIIDVAYKYGYDTPESFTKAFNRFHGFNPSKIKENNKNINVFLPLKIKVSIQGGMDMDYTIEKMDGFKLIGFVKEFDEEISYEEVPKFWNQAFGIVMANLKKNNFMPTNEIEEAFIKHSIGEFGLCFEGANSKFKYMIGGIYKGGNVPSGMEVYEVMPHEWAIFKAIGPLPYALQDINTKIFKEWLPNSNYQIDGGIDIEWYGLGDTSSDKYESAIWIPIKK